MPVMPKKAIVCWMVVFTCLMVLQRLVSRIIITSKFFLYIGTFSGALPLQALQIAENVDRQLDTL